MLFVTAGDSWLQGLPDVSGGQSMSQFCGPSNLTHSLSLSLREGECGWAPPYPATSAPTIGQPRPIPTRFLIFNWKTREPRTGKGEDRRLKMIGFVKQS